MLGALRGAYGLKGWVRIQPFQDGEALIKSHNWIHVKHDQSSACLEVEQVKVHGSGIVAKLKGIDSPEAAEALKGAVGLYRKDFPLTAEDEYYWVDLIGCKVVNRQGQDIGTVKSIIETGANDVLEVATAGNKSVLVPFVANYLEEVDLNNKTIHVDWSLDWI